MGVVGVCVFVRVCVCACVRVCVCTQVVVVMVLQHYADAKNPNTKLNPRRTKLNLNYTQVLVVMVLRHFADAEGDVEPVLRRAVNALRWRKCLCTCTHTHTHAHARTHTHTPTHTGALWRMTILFPAPSASRARPRRCGPSSPAFRCVFRLDLGQV